MMPIRWPDYLLGPLLREWRRGRPLEQALANAWGLHLDHYRDIERRRQPPPSIAAASYELLAAFIAEVDGDDLPGATWERFDILVHLRDLDRATWARLPSSFWEALRAHSAGSVRR
jgi:hypothetical protein